MKYAVLTTNHVAGYCLWPTMLNDCHVGTSGNITDVVEAFVNACNKSVVISVKSSYGVFPNAFVMASR